MLLDTRWNHMVYVNGAISDAIARAPATAQRNYFEAKKNPFIIHYASENKPWFNPELEFADDFWEIARQTIFYESILNRMVDKKMSCIGITAPIVIDARTGIRKLADRLLPIGTRRRKFAKLLIPKGSLRWRFCKQIYYIFKPQYRPAKVK